MGTAEAGAAAAASSDQDAPGPRGEARRVADISRRAAWPLLGALLAIGLLLRLWGVRQGLPFVYNVDEADHFVTRAAKMFAQGTLDPHYFANPPAFTYVLHVLFGIWFGSGASVVATLRSHPQEVYTLARVVAAVLGTAALWLLYGAAARLFDRRVALLATAIETVAFLPVFYAHLALNDAPTLVPATLALLGSAGILRRGAKRDSLLAGAGLGIACATKYTAGIMLLPLLAAVAARYLEQSRPGAPAPALAAQRALISLALAGAAAVAAFLIFNPYTVLDYSSFHHELVHQSTLSSEAQGKLGAPGGGGLRYYLWSLTWGLGWAPALAALGGAVLIWRRDAAVGWMLVPAALLFLAFMSVQGRYFGRWLLPSFPLLCMLAAFFAVTVADAATARLSAWRERRRASSDHAAAGAGRGARALMRVPLSLLVVGLLIQGAIYSIHSGRVFSRADTRNLTRSWMLANIPRGSRIVVEPIAPDNWVREIPGADACPERRWCKYASETSRIDASGALRSGPPRPVTIEDYERTLSPALIGYYTEHGYCWVISGSTESGRAYADPRAVPNAIAYYRTLARSATVAYRASPYRNAGDHVGFSFDWSFDDYPLAYHRPGPVVTVYRLHGARCG